MAIAPAVATGIGLALNVASTGLAVVGSLAGAASEATAYEEAAKTAARNKEIAEENAQRTLLVAQEEQLDSDMEAAALIGRQEAIQAASGLRLESGSFIQTRAAARALARIDALNIHEAARIRAMAYRNEGDAYAAEADSNRRAAGTARLGGFLNAATSLVSGASKAISIAPSRTNGRMTVPASVML